jgi:hypothetical protein
MVGALVPEASFDWNAPCPAAPRPTTAGTDFRICWTDCAGVDWMSAWPTLIRFEPTGGAPRMLEPVTMMSLPRSASVVCGVSGTVCSCAGASAGGVVAC